MVNYKIFIKLFIISFALVNFTTNYCLAGTQNRTVKLDTATVAKGYTLANFDNEFSLGLQPETLKKKTTLHFRPINPDKKGIIFPADLNLISPVYLYNVKFKNQKTLKKELWLSIRYTSTSENKKDVYYFDNSQNQWLILEHQNDKNNSLMTASSANPFMILAVFEDPNKLEIPEKSRDYTKFSDALDAVSAISIDEESGEILYQKNINEVRSIASLTKVMTAMVFLDSGVSMDKVITYNSANDREGAMLYVSDGETMTVRDIFYTMLVGSANNCALTLADSTGYSREDFVQKMNEKAAALGLTNTHFEDPSGLEVNNLSTAYDYALLANAALDYAEIQEATTTANYSFYTINTNDFHSINNTSPILNWSMDVTGGKTGYIDEALYCMMLQAKEDNHQVITVILGNPSSLDRFYEAYNLTNWAFDNFVW